MQQAESEPKIDRTVQPPPALERHQPSAE
ncbi:MAG: hypothetical protein QOK10_1082, partial [Pseudonocardiales bacterium]|nr:hypothetical protein [Pseudonocardiales bacterium]